MFWLLSKTFGHALPRFTSGVFWARGQCWCSLFHCSGPSVQISTR